MADDGKLTNDTVMRRTDVSLPLDEFTKRPSIPEVRNLSIYCSLDRFQELASATTRSEQSAQLVMDRDAS